MASTTTGQNRRLCGDILRIIFDHYAPYETLQYPLETLLLVCTDWHDAALSHRKLWSTFRLHVEHGNPDKNIYEDSDEEMEEDTEEETDEETDGDPHGFLLRQTALRLQRSGMAPLDIELINLLAYEASPPFDGGYIEAPPLADGCPYSRDYGLARSCPCYTSAYECSCQLLVLLAGRKGEHCKRWRTLTFFPNCETPSEDQEAQITQALSYPMPLLESLTLQRISITGLDAPFMPYTPSLVRLGLDECDIPALRGTKNLRFAAISRDLDGWEQVVANEACLEKAMELEVLRISLPGNFNLALPRDLPNLRELWLSGSELPHSVRTLKMQGLNHLTIEVYDVSLIGQLTQCVNEAIWQVNELTLQFLHVHNHPAFTITMSQLFKLFIGVNVLRGDHKMLSFTMKLMWEQASANYHVTPVGSARMFGERKIKLRGMDDDDTCVVLSPGALPEQIVNAAAELRVVDPRTTWTDLRRMLDKPEEEFY